MKKKLAIPNNRPLADFLPTLTKALATGITSHNVIEKDLYGEASITVNMWTTMLLLENYCWIEASNPSVFPDQKM